MGSKDSANIIVYVTWLLGNILNKVQWQGLKRPLIKEIHLQSVEHNEIYFK